MGDKNRDIAEYYKKQSRGEQDDKMLDRIVGGGKRERAAKAEERKAKREYRDERILRNNVYIVRPGDSWFSIAGSELGDQRYAGELARANPGFDVLNPGAVLRLPPLDENETPVLTYGDQETLEGIQEKLEAAKQEAVEQAANDDTEIDPLEVAEERKRGFAEMGEMGAYGLEEEYEYEAEAQALAKFLLDISNEKDNVVSFKLAALSRDRVLQDGLPPTPANAHESPEVNKDWETIQAINGEAEPELAVVPTQEIEPTEAAPEELPGYTELVTAQETSWEEWQMAFEGAEIAWQDAEGNLNVEEISIFIAADIEANKEQYAQELGLGVDGLAKVSSERVGVWLEAAELHEQLDVFNMRILLLENDEDIFGVEITAKGLSLDEYKGQYVQFPDSQPLFDQTRNNMNAAFVNIGFALMSVSLQFSDPGEAFRTVFLNEETGEGVKIDFDANRRESGCVTEGRSFTCNLQELVGGNKSIDAQLIAHELGHVFETEIGRVLQGYTSDQQEYLHRQSLLQPRGILDSIVIYDENGEPVAGQDVPRDNLGMQEDWLQNTRDVPAEEFADMFTHWVLGGFTDDPAGQALDDWFGTYAPLWVKYATQDFNPAWIEEEETRRQASDD